MAILQPILYISHVDYLKEQANPVLCLAGAGVCDRVEDRCAGTCPVVSQNVCRAHLVYISLSDDEHQFRVLLHHSPVLQHSLHFDCDLLTPGWVLSLLGARHQHLLPQQPIIWGKEGARDGQTEGERKREEGGWG